MKLSHWLKQKQLTFWLGPWATTHREQVQIGLVGGSFKNQENNHIIQILSSAPCSGGAYESVRQAIPESAHILSVENIHKAIKELCFSFSTPKSKYLAFTNCTSILGQPIKQTFAHALDFRVHGFQENTLLHIESDVENLTSDIQHMVRKYSQRGTPTKPAHIAIKGVASVFPNITDIATLGHVTWHGSLQGEYKPLQHQSPKEISSDIELH